LFLGVWQLRRAMYLALPLKSATVKFWRNVVSISFLQLLCYGLACQSLGEEKVEW